MKTYLIELPPQTNLSQTDFVEILEQLHETLTGQTFSLELAVFGQNIGCAFSGEASVCEVIKGQFYAAYPEAEIRAIPDFLPAQTSLDLAQAETFLQRKDLYGLKPITDFTTDSLSSFLQVCAQCREGEKVWLQLVCKSVSDSAWLHIAQRFRTWIEMFWQYFRFKYWFKKGVRGQFRAHINEKNKERLFKTSLRLGVQGKNSKDRLQALTRALSTANTVDFNQLGFKHKAANQTVFKRSKNRELGASFLLSSAELATLFHLPQIETVPNLIHVMSRKGEAAADLPVAVSAEISQFGKTNFHGKTTAFGIKRSDRRRHLYCVGKSGSGKSKFLELLIESDLKHGQGLAVLDPHGDLVDNVLRMLPESRLKDVVIFDPSDIDFPVSFNPLANVKPEQKMRVTIGFIEVFKKLFGVGWTPRLEHVLRYTVLALLDTPGASLVSIQQMLTDKNFRQSVVKNIKDDVVKNFWTQEFAAWSQKFDAEAITPLLNKVGQFIATNQVRNLVGQRENTLDFRRFMDEGKIVLMKVSKGMLGEENAQLLGAMLVTRIYQAAMSRADMAEEDRRDFYFYVDEFQNFATDTFDEILSEARKYRLNLTLAHQFLGQLPDNIRTTVFGNVGSMVSFRVGGEDAKILAEEFNPRFTERDIINLGVREFYCKMSVNGEMREAFSGRTLDLNFPSKDMAEVAREFSRKNYARPLKEVEQNVANQTVKAEPDEPEFTEPLV